MRRTTQKQLWKIESIQVDENHKMEPIHDELNKGADSGETADTSLPRKRSLLLFLLINY